jgi:hypothetical protein
MCDVSEDFEVVEGEEVVEGLPVVAEVHEVELAPVSRLGAVQAVAAAATGFVAGAATMALARRYGARRLERPRPSVGTWPQAPGTRTYLVHVRVLGRPWE